MPGRGYGSALEQCCSFPDVVMAYKKNYKRAKPLFKPQGFHPARGLASELRRALERAPNRHVFVLRSQERGFDADDWGAYEKDLRGTLCRPRDPGMLLVRRSWLMQQPWRPAQCVSYWTWILVVEALSQRVAEIVTTPVVLRDAFPAIVNICVEYAKSLDLNGNRKAELPYPELQWQRLGIDILAALSERIPTPASAAFAMMASDSGAAGDYSSTPQIDTVGRLEDELDAVYASASWRLTAPLRALADAARHVRARMSSGRR